MSYETVDVFLKDSIHGDPIPGVVVRAYDAAGKLFYTQALSDINGVASFLLNTQDYQLRFYKFQVAFPNPLYITVQPGSNVFDVTADLVAIPSAVDPRFCTAYGFFRRPDGKPAVNVDIHFINKFSPLILENTGMVSERIIERTDSRGYVQVDLVRCGQYDATVAGVEDQVRLISVPDAPNVLLPDLLFPVVARVDFDPPPPWTVVKGGDDLIVTPIVHGTDGSQLTMDEVIWSSSDYNTLGILIAGGKITLRGLDVGSASLQGIRANQTIVRIPDTPIEGLPQVVTVT